MGIKKEKTAGKRGGKRTKEEREGGEGRRERNE